MEQIQQLGTKYRRSYGQLKGVHDCASKAQLATLGKKSIYWAWLQQWLFDPIDYLFLLSIYREELSFLGV